MKGLELVMVKRTDPDLLERMSTHYSQPRGFIGRSICYAIDYDGVYYGHIVYGSSTKFLPGRNEYFGINQFQLYKVASNLFYNVSKVDGRYPTRNFTTFVLKESMKLIRMHWKLKYKDDLVGVETLVQLPRTGELYRRAGFVEIGQTKGFTCKREAGIGTDTWHGKRVWNRDPKEAELRKKRVLVYKFTGDIDGS